MTKRRSSSKKTSQTSVVTVVITAIVAVVLYILSSVFGIDLSGLLGGGTAVPTARNTAVVEATPKPRTTLAATVTPVNVRITYPKMPTRSKLEERQIVRVSDGDTVVVNENGKNLTVRLIGLNTPETVDPRRPVECFGKEASNRAKQLLTGKTVYLEIDPSQDTVDAFGRALRFLWYDNGKLFNMQMIAEGYAYEYTYERAYKYQAEFRQAQKDAESQDRGLWATNTCNGEK